jgi:hypothetical protein
MGRRPNYGFQKQQKDLAKQKKRDEKEAKKRLKSEATPGSVPVEDDSPKGEDS